MLMLSLSLYVVFSATLICHLSAPIVLSFEFIWHEKKVLWQNIVLSCSWPVVEKPYRKRAHNRIILKTKIGVLCAWGEYNESTCCVSHIHTSAARIQCACFMYLFKSIPSFSLSFFSHLMPLCNLFFAQAAFIHIWCWAKHIWHESEKSYLYRRLFVPIIIQKKE